MCAAFPVHAGAVLVTTETYTVLLIHGGGRVHPEYHSGRLALLARRRRLHVLGARAVAGLTLMGREGGAAVADLAVRPVQNTRDLGVIVAFETGLGPFGRPLLIAVHHAVLAGRSHHELTESGALVVGTRRAGRTCNQHQGHQSGKYRLRLDRLLSVPHRLHPPNLLSVHSVTASSQPVAHRRHPASRYARMTHSGGARRRSRHGWQIRHSMSCLRSTTFHPPGSPSMLG